jgi:ABC-type phosphate transport system substrate-binding protein
VHQRLVNSLRKLFSAPIVALIVDQLGPLWVSAKETVRVPGSTTVLPLAEAGEEAFNADIMGPTTAETPGVSTVAGSNAEIKTALTGSNKATGR